MRDDAARLTLQRITDLIDHAGVMRLRPWNKHMATRGGVARYIKRTIIDPAGLFLAPISCSA